MALVADGGSVTYAELAGQARGIGAHLHQAGIGPGDVGAIQFPNIHQACAADLAGAAWALPAWPMGLPSRLRLALLRFWFVGPVGPDGAEQILVHLHPHGVVGVAAGRRQPLPVVGDPVQGGGQALRVTGEAGHRFR